MRIEIEEVKFGNDLVVITMCYDNDKLGSVSTEVILDKYKE